MDYSFQQKNVLVCGLARSGVAVAKLLKKLNATVTVQDLKTESQLIDVVSELKSFDVRFILGQNPDAYVEQFDYIVISPGLPIDLPFIVNAKEIGIPVLSEIEVAQSVCDNTVLAITGTNGKTTTTMLVQTIMNAYFKGSVAVGNVGVPFSEKVGTIPKEAVVVAEISSFQMESTYSFHPLVSAVLNITPDHLNRHGTLKTYIAMKKRIFENQTEEDYTVLNYDDSACRKMAEETKGKVVFFSAESQLQSGIFLKNDSIWATLSGYDEKVIEQNKLQILGKHNLENAMAAIAICICTGVPLDSIRKGLKAFSGVEHRIEFVTTIDGVDFYNDSKATNTDSAIKGLEAMKKPTVLIAGGQRKGVSYEQWVALFPKKVSWLVAFGETADEIIEECSKVYFTNVKKVFSLEEAVAFSKKQAREGEAVLLSPACASLDMFKDYEERGRMFKQLVITK